MKIEKKFFTNQQLWIEQQQKKFLQDRQRQSPEVRAAEEAKIQAAVDHAMKMVEQHSQEIEASVASNRSVRFFEMANKIVPVAEWMHMDVCINAHKTDMGQIILTTDSIVIDEFCPAEIRADFLEVVSAADEILINSKNGLTEIMLYFQRFDVVKEG